MEIYYYLLPYSTPYHSANKDSAVKDPAVTGNQLIPYPQETVTGITVTDSRATRLVE